MNKGELNIKKLKTVKNYAVEHDVTPQYIYKLVRENRMSLFEIDGVKFVQTDLYQSIPVSNRRK